MNADVADGSDDDGDEARVEQQAQAILAKFDTSKLTAPFRKINVNLANAGLSKALIDHSGLLKSFQVSTSASRALSKIAADQTQWLQAMQRAMPSAATFAKLAELNIGQRLVEEAARTRPSNFAALLIAEQRAVIEVGCREAIGTVETFSAERLRELAALETRGDVDVALCDWAEDFPAIIDRMNVLAESEGLELQREHVRLLAESTAALHSSYSSSSQALSTVVWDSHCSSRFGKSAISHVDRRSGISFDEATFTQFYFRAAYGPLLTAYSRSDRPDAYSRNATVHGAQAKQFSRANATRALSCALGAVAHQLRWPTADGAAWSSAPRGRR